MLIIDRSVFPIIVVDHDDEESDPDLERAQIALNIHRDEMQIGDLIKIGTELTRPRLEYLPIFVYDGKTMLRTIGDSTTDVRIPRSICMQFDNALSHYRDIFQKGFINILYLEIGEADVAYKYLKQLPGSNLLDFNLYNFFYLTQRANWNGNQLMYSYKIAGQNIIEKQLSIYEDAKFEKLLSQIDHYRIIINL